MKTIYLAGPYTHDDPMIRELRHQLLLKAEAHLLRRGFAVISPINMCHELGKIYGFAYGYDYWQERDRTLISKCDELVCLTEDGYKESVGVTDELYYATKIGVPISYISPEELDPKGGN
jgi:hypothetical protein